MTDVGISDKLSWSEIRSWSEITGIQPMPFEANLMIKVARSWANEYSRGYDPEAMIRDEWLEYFNG